MPNGIGIARAADVNGAWASDPKACDRIFQKKKSAFARGTDTNGSGFILDGNNIRGRIANCKIKTRKQDGDLVHIVAACATDVMLSDVEVTLKLIDDNTLARVFAGLPENQTTFYRCPR
jgi:hypothetical protein